MKTAIFLVVLALAPSGLKALEVVRPDPQASHSSKPAEGLDNISKETASAAIAYLCLAGQILIWGLAFYHASVEDESKYDIHS